MYTPPAFAEDDPETLHGVMREHPFVVLMSQSDSGPLLTHLPLLLEPGAGKNGVLWGHMARANPHWQALERNPAALAVFWGPHAYVSPAWYAHQPSVPTWNYVTVHAHGRVETIHDPAALQPMMADMTAAFEGDDGWRFADLPDDFRQRQLKGIVGIRLAIDRLEGKLKLSQNRPKGDAERVVAALDARDDADSRATAAAMRRFGVVD